MTFVVVRFLRRLCFLFLSVITDEKEKADVSEHPEVFDHVGLLVNEPPGTAGLFFV